MLHNVNFSNEANVDIPSNEEETAHEVSIGICLLIFKTNIRVDLKLEINI